LENALFSTLQNAELRRDLAQNGIRRAERYSWERVVSQVEEVYEQALVLGPSVTEGPRVPVVKQARHFMRSWIPRARKPREAGSQAAG
jgi:hypothetical protein